MTAVSRSLNCANADNFIHLRNGKILHTLSKVSPQHRSGEEALKLNRAERSSGEDGARIGFPTAVKAETAEVTCRET